MPTTDGPTPATPPERIVPAAEPEGVPAIQELEKHLAHSDYGGGIRAAFPLVMIDVQLSYDLRFPSHWTARDVLAHGLRADMGRLPDLLFQLYSLYEPVRFGLERDWIRGDVRKILHQIYTETALRSRPVPPMESRPAPSSLSRPTFSVVPVRAELANPSKEAGRW